MSNDILWNTEAEVSDYVTVPAFIEQDITCSDVAAILQGGCDSGAYMPAVEYATALETMQRHGNDVFDLLDEYGVDTEYVAKQNAESWSHLAVGFVSIAVEVWASSIEEELTEALEDEALEIEDDD